MPVLTEKEYNKTKTVKKKSSRKQAVKKKQPVTTKSKKRYWFLHPENPMEWPINADLELHCFGEKKEELIIPIKDGQVTTEREDVAEYFRKANYILIKEEEIENI